MCVTSPLDTMRCRWQVTAAADDTLAGFVRQIIHAEGLWTGLWRPGLPANMAAMALAVGGRNGFYPVVRDGLGWTVGGNEKVGPVGMFAAGLCAGMVSYMLASPFLQVKTQMQVEAGLLSSSGVYLTGARKGHAPTYTGSLQALKWLASEGAATGGGLAGSLRQLWRGASIVVARGATLSASQLAAYDSTKTGMKEVAGWKDGPLLHCIAAQAGAISCTTCTMPLDATLTFYASAQNLGQTQRERYASGGPLRCARAMLQHHGLSVFFRGWVPAFLRMSPTVTLSFSLYEQLRRLVGLAYLD